jgi:hypothetical protein
LSINAFQGPKIQALPISTRNVYAAFLEKACELTGRKLHTLAGAGYLNHPVAAQT